jgi:hypothetical protein
MLIYTLDLSIDELQELTICFWENKAFNPLIIMAEA